MSIKSLMLREWDFFYSQSAMHNYLTLWVLLCIDTHNRILDKIFFLCIIPINMIELVEYEKIPMMELNQMLKLKEG